MLKILKFDEQKERQVKGRRIAQRLKETQPKLARSMSECRPDNQCRVAGCPSCEWRTGRRASKHLYRACRAITTLYPNVQYFYLSLPLPLIEIEDLEESLTLRAEAVQKLLDMIDSKASVQFISFSFFGGKISTKTSIILAVTEKSHLSRNDWNSLWRQTSEFYLVPHVEAWFVPVSKVPAIARQLSPYCDLSVCPDKILGSFAAQVQLIPFVSANSQGLEFDRE